MPIKKYKLLTDSQHDPRAKKGMTVYEFMHHDYGLSRDDTIYTGVEHRSYTLDPDGGYPSFTHPVAHLTEIKE